MIALDVANKDKWGLIINLHLSNDMPFTRIKSKAINTWKNEIKIG